MVNTDKISSCCFMCRQVISEFFDEDSKIILMNNLGESKEFTIKELCPLPFNSEDLS